MQQNSLESKTGLTFLKKWLSSSQLRIQNIEVLFIQNAFSYWKNVVIFIKIFLYTKISILM